MLSLYDRSAESATELGAAAPQEIYVQECVIPSTVSQVLMMMEDPRRADHRFPEQGYREVVDHRLGH